MGRKRGFFAEIAHQNQQARLHSEREQAAAYRAHQAALREQERLQRQLERAQNAASAADARTKARLEKDAAVAHAEAQSAEVQARNVGLAQKYEEIDGILPSTLALDDYVDLEALKVAFDDTPFDAGPVGVPTREMPELIYPPEPVYVEPELPKALFGAHKKHAKLIMQAQADHQRDLAGWGENNARLAAEHAEASRRRDQIERKRVEKLSELEAAYNVDRDRRKKEATTRNAELDNLINDLAFDVGSAIEEYIGIVLSNSVYPDSFPVEHDYQFELATRELTLTVTIPPPADLPTVKEYRYVKAKDEIAASTLPAKAQKDRYASAVAQVAVRSLHEVFEGDRLGKIHTISLTVGADAIDPATGRSSIVPFVIVAAGREQFTQFDLANVVPAATLQHLGAAVSKSPFDLTPADVSRGVRVRKQ